MPIDHYRMTIQAKPLASLGDKHHNEASEPVLLGIARPLGHLRKTKKSFKCCCEYSKAREIGRIISAS